MEKSEFLSEVPLEDAPDKAVFRSLGTSGTQEIGVLPIGSPFGSFDQEEELRLSDVSIEQLDEMTQKDGTARALFNIITLPIRAAKWSLVPADGGEDEHAFINAMLTLPPYRGGMSTPLDYIISVATKAVRQGFVAWEKVYKIDAITYTDEDGNEIKRDNAILLKKLAPRPSHQVTFRTDDHGGFNGFVQRVYYKGRFIEAFIPREKGLAFTVNKHENPLYGESMFLPAYYHYDKKHKLYYVAHMAYMANAIPARMGKYPANTSKELQGAFNRALANLGLNSVITMPEFEGDTAQYTVETFESRRQLADFTPLIEHHNSEMAKSVLAQFIQLGQGGRGGAYSLSSDQSEFFLMAEEALMAEIEYTINTFLIPEFVDLNFGTGKYPQFKFEPLVDSTKELLKTIFEKLVSASTKQVSDEFMLELEQRVSDEFGFAIDYDELKKRQEEDTALNREVRQVSQKAMMEHAKNPQPKEGNPPEEGGGALSEFLKELHTELSEFEAVIESRKNNPS